MTIQQALATTPITRRDAELLLAHILHQPRAFLLAHPETSLTPIQLEIFHQLTQRRAANEPLQYLTQQQEFYGLNLRVTPATLIPRPETEHLVEAVLLWATQFHDGHTLHIVDVGTGSGAIAIALATHLAGATFLATDISTEALAIAQQNAHAHHCEDRITFLESNLLDALDPAQTIDAIVSNPPYIPSTDASTLQPEVRDYEPHTALFAGPGGLDIYRRLIPQAHAALAPNGLLAMEIGFGQQAAITGLLAAWHNVRFIDDYAGIPRTVFATRP